MSELKSRISTEVIETTTAKKIKRLLNGTAKRAQFSYMFGPSGRGKTFVARDWIAKRGNAAYVRIRTGSTMTQVRKTVCEALFQEERGSQSDIIRYIKEHPGFVLVVDEAAHLIGDSDFKSSRNLDFLRDIYDEVNETGGKCGVCFIFTNYTLDGLKKSRLGLFLRQFINRGDNHLEISEKISMAYEIERLLEQWNPGFDEAFAKKSLEIVLKGGIRALEKRISIQKEGHEEHPDYAVNAENLGKLQEVYEDGRWEDK